MPSLSKTVLSGGWMIFSSWIVCCLGFNLVAVVVPVAAQPNPDLALAEATDRSVTDSSTDSLTRLDPSAAQVDAAPNSQTTASTIIEPNPSNLPVLIAGENVPADARSSPESGSEAVAVAEQTEIPGVEPISQAAPLPASTVRVSADQCLADCNPTAQFDFDPPNIAIPPRSLPSYERPAIAENPALPVPRIPSAGEGTLPPPPPSRVAGQSPQPQPQRSTVTADGSTVPTSTAQADVADSRRPVTRPTLQFQGVYLYQGGEDSARARLTGVYPILPELQVGASVDFTTGDVFGDSGGAVGDSGDGLEINELYVTGYLPDYPNLRLVVGQMDLTSYFDRNSFAKDSATHFFNPIFATNPALSAAGIGSRQGALVNWTIIDEVEVKAAVFSSDRSISDFEVNAFAGEVGVRLGNLIVRGTYVTAEDAGANTSFEESFQIARSNGDFGPRDGDREDAYGINAEFFIPEINMGIFGRYGWYNNRELDRGGETYSVGVNFLDLFLDSDRLGVAYGRALSNDNLRDGNNPDVFEAFYDFRVLPGLRLGFTFQGLDQFSETIGGVRVRTDFDLVPRRTQ